MFTLSKHLTNSILIKRQSLSIIYNQYVQSRNIYSLLITHLSRLTFDSMRLAKEDYTRAQANHTQLLEYSRFKTTTRIRLIRTLSLTICTNNRTVGKKVNQSGTTPQFKILDSYKGKFKEASVRFKHKSFQLSCLDARGP